MFFLRKNILLSASLLLSQWLCAQNFVINDGVTDNTCSGVFYDSGTQAGLGYSANENKTYTLCSDGSAGLAIKINFDAFDLDSKDTLRVYDGANTAASLLGKFSNDDLLGLTLTPSTSNPGGCLTFNFTSDNSVNGFWEGKLSCGNKCVYPVAEISGNDILKICPGQSISLDAINSTAGSASINEYKWLSKKDTVIDVTYKSLFQDALGIFIELRVTNSLGCSNINKEKVKVLVSTHPHFNGTAGDHEICLGEPACLNGIVSSTPYQEPTPIYTGGSLALPDQTGVFFMSNLEYSQFKTGQKLSSINDLKSICIDIEHSYISDLKITIICPNGQTANLHNESGGGRLLGIPVDDDTKPNDMGICGNYCFTPTGSGFLYQAATEGQTIPYGDYKSIDPLTNLLGCPLNGKWTLRIADKFPSDNGFLCSWGLSFNPNIIPQGITFTPTFNNISPDSTAWVSDASIVSTTTDGDAICAMPAAPGNKDYTYRVLNNFGCAYDTTITLRVFEFPTSILADTLNICESILLAPINLNVSTSAIGTYNYLWSPNTALNSITNQKPIIDVPNTAPFYIVQISDSGTPGCSLNDTINIKTIPVPTAQFTMDKSFGCVPLNIVFKDNTSPKPTNFHWIFGDGNETNGAVDTATHLYSIYGTKTVQYIITTNDGCSDTASSIANTSPTPLVLFNITPPYAYRDYPYFCFQNATELGGNNNTWIFDNIATSNNEHDCFMFPDTIACYKVSLINTNNFGCTDTLTQQVCVRDYQQKVFAPNAFTPNRDGINDVFTIQSTSIQSDGYHLYIFNRWGNVIFHSTTPNEGWDGKTEALEDKMEVYAYMLYYKDEWGKEQKYIGHVSLIR
jgi:gliding motility-associated-like protein